MLYLHMNTNFQTPNFYYIKLIYLVQVKILFCLFNWINSNSLSKKKNQNLCERKMSVFPDIKDFFFIKSFKFSLYFWSWKLF